ncbi:MAG: heme exporter protein CcmD [Parvularculales bacterium]
MMDWLAMGGYGFFVWGGFVLSAVVLGGLTIASVYDLRHQKTLLETLEADQQRTPKA